MLIVLLVILVLELRGSNKEGKACTQHPADTVRLESEDNLRRAFTSKKVFMTIAKNKKETSSSSSFAESAARSPSLVVFAVLSDLRG